MSDEGAFVRALDAEVKGAAHAALVELHQWSNSTGYGMPGDRAAAEAWAADIEARGLTFEILEATAVREL